MSLFCCYIGDFGDFGTVFGELGQVKGMFKCCGCSWVLISCMAFPVGIFAGGHLRMQAMSLEDCFLRSSNDLGCGGCSWTPFTVSQQEFYDTADECEVTVRDNL